MERISIASPVFCGNEKKYLMECIDTGWISANGRFVTEFEKTFADFCGVKHGLACANGTLSLHLSLLALGIGPGDEVIVPTLTYIATANCVRYCGATPVFVDSEESTFNIDITKIEEKITPRTKAIMPVHLYGLACDMPAINKIAKKHGLAVIEDAAEAHGAKINGKRVGGFSDVGSFSFFGNKIITCGEGGIVVTDQDDLYEQMKILRGQGMDISKRYWHTIIGYNYRMTNMQAAVGLGQLESIEFHLSERRRVVNIYKKYLGAYRDVLKMQHSPEGFTNVYWMNNIILQPYIQKSRDEVMLEMEKRNVEMRPLFYPIHIMPPYRDEKVSLPVAEGLSARGISLPTHSGLGEEDIEYICDNILKICELK